jgi:hypothetical protein
MSPDGRLTIHAAQNSLRPRGLKQPKVCCVRKDANKLVSLARRVKRAEEKIER